MGDTKVKRFKATLWIEGENIDKNLLKDLLEDSFQDMQEYCDDASEGESGYNGKINLIDASVTEV